MFEDDDSIECVGIAVADSWGIYCPQTFCQRYERNEEVSQDDWDCCLKGPHDNEWYWEAWTAVTDNWYQIENGKKITAYQDGDVFLVSEKSITEEEGKIINTSGNTAGPFLISEEV